MTLLALVAIIFFGFATYNLTCAFVDIPTKKTSRMMMLARKQQGVKAEKLLDVYITKIAGLIAPYLKLDMGTLANGDLRHKRILAHRALEQLRQSRHMEKWEVYIWLQAKLGLDERQAHIGQFSEWMCDEVVRLCRQASAPPAAGQAAA